MSLYNANGQRQVTIVSGASYTGLYAIDGTYNGVINDGVSVWQGAYHPCGALNVCITIDPYSTIYAPNGSLNVVTSGSSYALLGGMQDNPAPPLASSANVFVAWGLRTLITGYVGPLVNFRRSSDNATLDFFAASNGWLDTAAVSAWLGANTATIATWYDQGANAAHITQAVLANQPTYTPGTRPTLTFDGVNDALAKASITWAANDLTAFVVANLSAGASYRSFFNVGALATSGLELSMNMGGASVDWLTNDASAFGNGSNAGLAPRLIITTPGFNNGVLHQHDLTLSAAGNDWITDGVTKTARTGTAGQVPAVTGSMNVARTSSFFKGTLSELIVFNTVYGSRPTLRANQKAAWGTP